MRLRSVAALGSEVRRFAVEGKRLGIYPRSIAYLYPPGSPLIVPGEKGITRGGRYVTMVS